MIIDSHCHAGKGDGLTGPWDTDASLDKYLARAERAGIQKTVLFAAFHSDYAAANREVARIVARQPNRFYGYAFVHAVNNRSRMRSLVKTAVEEYGFIGIKVHRHDARVTREVCEAARAFRPPCSTTPRAKFRSQNCWPRNILTSISSSPTWEAFLIIGRRSRPSSIRYRAILIFIRIRRASGVSICWSRRCGALVREKFCLDRMAPGCIRDWSWRKLRR